MVTADLLLGLGVLLAGLGLSAWGVSHLGALIQHAREHREHRAEHARMLAGAQSALDALRQTVEKAAPKKEPWEE